MNKNKIFDLKQFSLVELNKEQQAKTQGGAFGWLLELLAVL
jgi:hypothetical protein